MVAGLDDLAGFSVPAALTFALALGAGLDSAERIFSMSLFMSSLVFQPYWLPLRFGMSYLRSWTRADSGLMSITSARSATPYLKSSLVDFVGLAAALPFSFLVAM